MPVSQGTRGRIAVVINPISGARGRPEEARQRAALAADLLHARGVDAEVLMTESPGHGRALTLGALARGASIVVAWGGDGTVNEVASALVGRDAVLGVVPSGSGNGLARELRIPCDPEAALRVAVEGRTRRIDAGELNGRLFFNVAGVGLDAEVAHRFAARPAGAPRGFLRYLQIAARELCTFEPAGHTIEAEGVTIRLRALIIAFANARQYGNRAVIAPHARLDDGRLDVVAVAYRRPWTALWQAPALFAGCIDRVPGVTMTQAAHVMVTSDRGVRCHVDGEPYAGGTSLVARAHPGALRVQVAG